MQRDNNIPKGYKPSPFGPIPIDWDIKKGEDVALKITKGSSPNWQGFQYQDEGVLFVTSENVRDGYLDVNNPKYLPIEFNDKLKNSVLKKGDILINIVGASIGRSCIYNIDTLANINQAVCLFRPNSDFNLSYLSNFLNFPKSIDRLLNTQSDSARPNLTLEDIRNFPFILPSRHEQTAIANLLSTWDKAINTLTQLIAQKELRKKWLMQQLLTGKKRLKGFKEKWEEVELGELLNYEQPTRYLVKDTLYNDKYPTPVLTAGKTFVLGYTNEENGICTDLPVIIFDDFTTASKYVDFPFKAKSSAMKLLRPKATANVKFVFEAMQLMKYAIGGHERHWISKFVYLTIPCPPIEEQTAIARVLQSADAELKLLNQKLDKLKEQKKGLMQVLLTGKKRLNY